MNLWRRFLSDCCDLWTLITKGQPENDDLLPYHMALELAKVAQFDQEDIDAWEGQMYALPGNYAFWFAHDRYAGTPYDWPKKVKPAPQAQIPDYARQLINVSGNHFYGNNFQNNIVGIHIGG